MFAKIESSWDNGKGFNSLQAHLAQKKAKEACHIFFVKATQEKLGQRALCGSKPMISLTPW